MLLMSMIYFGNWSYFNFAVLIPLLCMNGAIQINLASALEAWWQQLRGWSGSLDVDANFTHKATRSDLYLNLWGNSNNH